MRTNSGAKYDYLSGEVEGGPLNFKVDFLVPLSRIPRFNGATNDYVTIAAHGVVVARVAIAMGEGQRVADLCLHHDDEEALVGDLPSPLKSVLGRDVWDPIAHKAAQAAAVASGLAERVRFPTEAELLRVKFYDGVALEAERRTQKKGPTWKVVETDPDFETAVRHAIAFEQEAIAAKAAHGYQAVHAYMELDRDIRREAYWK
jgi:hypothetical protein